MGVAVALLAGCSSEPPVYTADDLTDAATSTLDPPSGWIVLPGPDAPMLDSIGPLPDKVVGFDIQMSVDGGATWTDTFGSPIRIANNSYSVQHLQSMPPSAGDPEFRARWITPGPEVSPWSDPRSVKPANSVRFSCSTKVAAAALIPVSQDNEAEIQKSLDACGSVEEWLTAVFLNPQAVGYDFGTRDQIDVGLTVKVACPDTSIRQACQKPDLGVYASLPSAG